MVCNDSLLSCTHNLDTTLGCLACDLTKSLCLFETSFHMKLAPFLTPAVLVFTGSVTVQLGAEG